VMSEAGPGAPGHDRGLTLLFAVAGGAAVGNLCWAQPLLELVAQDLKASTATAAWLVTATQIGYAAGILLIVPLWDVLNRRRLVPVMVLCSAAALAGCALAPSIGVLLFAITLVGLTTVARQLLTPLAGDLADDAHRGQVVGTVASKILIGILVSRTVSGLVADAAGWRVIYIVAAAAAVGFAVLLYRVIPPLAPKTRMSYPALLASFAAVVARERTVRWMLVIGATGRHPGAPFDAIRRPVLPGGRPGCRVVALREVEEMTRNHPRSS
jgi:predicted MFS family arabinose efflux permease